MKMSDYERIALLNAECFGFEDEYSDINAILRLLALSNGNYLVTRKDGDIAAYLLGKTTDEGAQIVRLGSAKSHRGEGLALGLVKKVVRQCRDAGCRLDTYCSVTNITSLNIHLKAGMAVRSITTEWVNLEYDPER